MTMEVTSNEKESHPARFEFQDVPQVVLREVDPSRWELRVGEVTICLQAGGGSSLFARLVNMNETMRTVPASEEG